MPFTGPQCDHDPVLDNKGRRISPYRDYGRGLEGALVCATCGSIVEETPQPSRSKT